MKTPKISEAVRHRHNKIVGNVPWQERVEELEEEVKKLKESVEALEKSIKKLEKKSK